MADTATTLAEWATGFTPEATDFSLAQRSLVDTAAVALAARRHPIGAFVADAPDAARWATLGHVLDFDDLHIESTTHISVVVVPAVLAAGGDMYSYLAGSGVMARLGAMLGWHHYSAGWHATATAGAPAAAVAAGTALGLSNERLATAMTLTVSAAGGVQDAFGTHGKSLQVGFAAQAGVRAALLARAGATAESGAIDTWLDLLGASSPLDITGPAVPGGLAVKVYPCCYAMQRPIAALREVRERVRPPVRRVLVRTPEDTVRPLIHDEPRTGLEGKFSLPYAVATALLDDYPDFAAFTDAAVSRARARELLGSVEVVPTGDDGGGLLAGEVDIEIEHDGDPLRARLEYPPGSPARPPTDAEMREKLQACGADVPGLLANGGWRSVRDILAAEIPRSDTSDAAPYAW